EPVSQVAVHLYTLGKLQLTAGGATDGSGQVALRLPPGNYFSSTSSRTADVIAHRGTFTVAAEPARQSYTIRLTPGCVVKVKAVDATTGQPAGRIAFYQESETEPGTREWLESAA